MYYISHITIYSGSSSESSSGVPAGHASGGPGQRGLAQRAADRASQGAAAATAAAAAVSCCMILNILDKLNIL